MLEAPFGKKIYITFFASLTMVPANLLPKFNLFHRQNSYSIINSLGLLGKIHWFHWVKYLDLIQIWLYWWEGSTVVPLAQKSKSHSMTNSLVLLGKIHWFLFIALLVILLLNLLIAMMGWVAKMLLLTVWSEILVMVKRGTWPLKTDQIDKWSYPTSDTYAKIAEIKNEWMRQWARSS